MNRAMATREPVCVAAATSSSPKSSGRGVCRCDSCLTSIPGPFTCGHPRGDKRESHHEKAPPSSPAQHENQAEPDAALRRVSSFRGTTRLVVYRTYDFTMSHCYSIPGPEAGMKRETPRDLDSNHECWMHHNHGYWKSIRSAGLGQNKSTLYNILRISLECRKSS